MNQKDTMCRLKLSDFWYSQTKLTNNCYKVLLMVCYSCEWNTIASLTAYTNNSFHIFITFTTQLWNAKYIMISTYSHHILHTLIIYYLLSWYITYSHRILLTLIIYYLLADFFFLLSVLRSMMGVYDIIMTEMRE